MPVVKVVHDGLRHCLCPSFRLTVHRKLLNRRKASIGHFRRPSSNDPHSALLQCSSAAQQFPSRCYEKRYLQTGFFSARLGTRHVRGVADKDPPADYTNLTTQDAYEELRRASIQADALRVHAVVELLVLHRHEKPNPRLYQALLLANADSYHGSPAEVRRLLREMEDENIMPDASTYHAVLKVWCTLRKNRNCL